MRTYFPPFWSSVVWRRVACLVLVIALLAMGTLLVRSGTHAAGTQTAAGIPHPSHVVIVVEENSSADDIIGSSDAPYINSLAQQGAVFTNASGVSHPSEPNYLALFSGSTHGLSSDSCPHTFSGPDLGGELIAAGDTFSGYSETMPSVGFTGCNDSQSLYARKHNPWSNFTDVPTSANLPFTSFPSGNFSSLPTVSFVVPNLQDDMHDGSTQQADSWLKQHLDSYVQWAKTNNSLLIVTWDEGDGFWIFQDNHIPMLFVGPMVKAGQYSESVNHYSVLRTLEDMYGLPYANNSATATSITDVWQ